jgi:2-dehydro-3-deoxyphosphogluconate aldolase / (4S)-4-hydroxy-2-oxoglutarate aldolase
MESACRSLDRGAKFLTSPGLDLKIMELLAEREAAVFAGVDPAKLWAAWKAGADFVKV